MVVNQKYIKRLNFGLNNADLNYGCTVNNYLLGIVNYLISIVQYHVPYCLFI